MRTVEETKTVGRIITKPMMIAAKYASQAEYPVILIAGTIRVMTPAPITWPMASA